MALTGLRLIWWASWARGRNPRDVCYDCLMMSLYFCLAAVHSSCSMFYNGKMILKVFYPNLTPCTSRPGYSWLWRTITMSISRSHHKIWRCFNHLQSSRTVNGQMQGGKQESRPLKLSHFRSQRCLNQVKAADLSCVICTQGLNSIINS